MIFCVALMNVNASHYCYSISQQDSTPWIILYCSQDFVIDLESAGKLLNGHTHTLLIAVSSYVLRMDIHLDVIYFTEFHNLYLLYNAPIADVIKDYNMSYHFYADDRQIYMSFQPSSYIVTLDEFRPTIEARVADINEWMTDNKLNRIEQ